MEKTTAACGGGGEDFLIEILVRLPVVSLLRFKSVCKSWLQLIETSFFIDLHTNFNSSSSSSSNSKQQQQQQQQQQLGGGGGDSFILQAQHYEPVYTLMFSEILMLSSESGCGSEYGDWCCWDIDGSSSLHKLYNLGLPSSLSSIRGKLSGAEVIAGSCNGLICLVSDKYFFMRLDKKQCSAVSLWLWNPATRQSRILPRSFGYFFPPPLAIQMCSLYSHFVAFGFDLKTKDYKVMQITYLKDTTTTTGITAVGDSCQVEVYSLSTDSWRLLEGINSLPGNGIPNKGWLYHYHHGLYLNGSCFFVASAPPKSNHNHHCFIISFDFTKEIFNTILFPHPDHHHVVSKRWYLSCLGDKLALFTIGDYNNNDDDYGYGYEDCDIWVLNENGSKESWTKLHSFQIKRRGAREWIIPRGILNNGEFALLQTISTDGTKNKMQLYNLVTKEAKADFPIWDAVATVLVYKPSLVSITGGRKWHRRHR